MCLGKVHGYPRVRVAQPYLEKSPQKNITLKAVSFTYNNNLSILVSKLAFCISFSSLLPSQSAVVHTILKNLIIFLTSGIAFKKFWFKHFFCVGDIFFILGELMLQTTLAQKKIYCKGEPCMSSGWRAFKLQTQRQSGILLLLYKDL